MRRGGPGCRGHHSPTSAAAASLQRREEADSVWPDAEDRGRPRRPRRIELDPTPRRPILRPPRGTLGRVDVPRFTSAPEASRCHTRGMRAWERQAWSRALKPAGVGLAAVALLLAPA